MEITEEELKNKIDEAVKEATKSLFTQDQVNKAISTRINEEKEKHKKDIEEREKLAKMTAEEKQKHDFDVLTQERDSLKKSLAERDHKDKILNLMSDKKIDNGFYDVFSNVTDYEKAGELMDKFNENVKKQVDAEVDGKLNPNVPNKPTNDKTDDAQLRNALGLS